MGLAKLNTSIQLLKLFDHDAKIIRDYRWLEANVGKLVPMELIVSVDKQYQYPTMEQRQNAAGDGPVEPEARSISTAFSNGWSWCRTSRTRWKSVFGEQGRTSWGGRLSAATFTPPILDPLDRQRYTVNSVLEKNRDRLLQENYLALDEDQSELWRISVRLGSAQRRRLRPVRMRS